jgi:CHAT domain-containing protein
MSSRPTRTGAFAGLAYSFFHAGAPAIVSTLFDVVDDRTAPLVTRFHKHYVRGIRGFDALRLAQIEVLRGTDGVLRPPAEWAAFIYSGW